MLVTVSLSWNKKDKEEEISWIWTHTQFIEGMALEKFLIRKHVLDSGTSMYKDNRL